MISLRQKLAVERLDARGEGLARHDGAVVAVPYALPGDVVIVERDGPRATLVEIETPGPDRVAAFCPHYGVCGGCAVQALAPAAYARWKESLLAEALRRAGLETRPEPLLDAHGEGRRRAVFHARMEGGRARAGFMAARSHDIVEIETCPVLEPRLAGAPLLARALATRLAGAGKPLDILVTATETGLDVDLRGHGPLGADATRALVGFALRQDLARLSNHGAAVATARAPVVEIGQARLALPPGAFLQATRAGEEALAAQAVAALRGARKVVDLFSGVGAFALRLAEFANVRAVDVDGA
ncbi:class I SAM-dependent RNA methyltransferase, partial [Methylocella sp.]|uniref:class I SAM-dependent RNA methyltransferase n=1 Tax=Methylocella sp. TaxID=1978226 RepID=UPI003784CE24